MASSWKVAYADFVTAMMAFFILMWIMNVVPPETKKALSGYFQEGGKGVPVERLTPSKEAEVNEETPSESSDKSEMEKSFARIAAELQIGVLDTGLNTQDMVSINSNDSGVLLRITGNMAFEENQAELTPSARRIMDEVAKELSVHKLYVVVRGHADTMESGAPLFPSNWELSAARATTAARYLIAKGVTPIMLISTAYADTKPLLPGFAQSAAQRNRRVEFFLYRPGEAKNILGG